MRLLALVLSVALLGGCFSMMEHAGDWWLKPGVSASQRDQDWTACSKAHRGSEAIAATTGIVAGVGGALVPEAVRGHDTAEGCMADLGYAYTPLGPDGKPWKP